MVLSKGGSFSNQKVFSINFEEPFFFRLNLFSLITTNFLNQSFIIKYLLDIRPHIVAQNIQPEEGGQY